MAKHNKVIEEQNIYQSLRECYEEMNDYLLELIDEHRRTEEYLIAYDKKNDYNGKCFKRRHSVPSQNSC